MKTLKLLFWVMLFILGLVGWSLAILSAIFGVYYAVMLNPQVDWVKVFTNFPADHLWIVALSFTFTGLFTSVSLMMKGVESMGIKKRELPKEKKEDSPAPADNIPQRYFLVSYYVDIENGYFYGNSYFNSETFPSSEYIHKRVIDFNKDNGRKIKSVIINNIFEFKSQRDYLDFRKEATKTE